MVDTSSETGIGQARPANTLRSELFLTARLGAPLALGEMGWMSAYIVDALMIGRLPHSALSIAASSLGNTIFYAIAFSAIGMMTGLQTLTAQAYGRGDESECRRLLVQALWINTGLTPVVMLATLASIPVLRFFNTPPDIVQETSRSLHALIWSTAPLLLYWSLRRYLQSVERVLFIVVSLLSSGLVNFVADWAFLFGHFGLPRLGVVGSAWATCVVRLFALVLLVYELVRSLSLRKQGTNRLQLSLRAEPRRIGTLLRIGWPAALESLADLGVSTYMSVLCAQLGATLLAAHQIVLDLDAFVYMAPLGLSYATSVRVGQSAGRNNASQARRATVASLILGLSYIAIAGTIFVSFPQTWASFYTNDPSVVAAAVPIFLLCGVLQMGDAAGILLAGALVGVGDTRTPLIINAVWSWAIGMPLAYFLVFHSGFALKGLWLGRVLAAVGSSLTLATIWRLRLRRRNLSVFPAIPPMTLPGLSSAVPEHG
ncbi:MAG: MATE family efflux transporter [Acidobacteriaceae bacterium]